jgi:hypothetical protein
LPPSPASSSLEDELEVLVELELEPSDASGSDPSDASTDPSDASVPASNSLENELEVLDDVELEDGSLELEELSGEASDGPVEELPQADRAAKCPVTTANAPILNHSRFKTYLRIHRRGEPTVGPRGAQSGPGSSGTRCNKKFNRLG